MTVYNSPSAIFSKVSKGQLLICRDLIGESLRLLGMNTIIIRKKEIYGIYIGDAPDDPGKNEVMAFRAMRDALNGQVNRNVKRGPAITEFINNGVKIVDGNYVINEKELNKLHDSLRESLGPKVAARVEKDILRITERQYQATKNLVDRAVKEYNRNVSRGLNKTDKAVIDVLSDQNNFFISNTYDRALIDRVNSTTRNVIEQGGTRRDLDVKLRQELSKDIPGRADPYYKVLANDVINRARTFAEVNAFEEARIRRYEVFAVMDERTTAICEQMDGRIFEVEVARKIVKDIKQFGVPQNESQVDQFKALRPWLKMDEKAAEAGKDALFFAGPKGEKIYVPNTTFSGTPGNWKPTGDKSLESSRQIQEVAPRGGNPPALPPYHGNCRTQVVVDEEDIRTQEWTETLSQDTIGPGQTMRDVSTGGTGVITSVGLDKKGEGIISIKEKGKTKKVSPNNLLTGYTPIVPPVKIPPVEKTLAGKEISAAAKEAKKVPRHSAEKISIKPSFRLEKTLSKKEIEKEIEKVRNILKTVPSEMFKNVKSVELNYDKIPGKPLNVMADYNYGTGKIRLKLGHKKQFTKGEGPFIRENIKGFSKTVIHEVGHNAHPFFERGLIANVKQEGVISNSVWRDWIGYDESMRRSKKTKWITEYAKTNEREHFAESFAYYFNDPLLLAKREPKAFQWFEENIGPLFLK